jgi:hypothetical protein
MAILEFDSARLISSLVNISPMGDAGDTHQRSRVIKDVNHAPIAYPDSPMVTIPLEFLASCGTGIVRQRHNLAVDAGKQRIV